MSLYTYTAYLAFIATAISSSTYAQQIVAHRGASHDAPENTLVSFEQAWEQQADVIEGDFYLTADGQIVCIHDKDTGRVCLTEVALKVADCRHEELCHLDVGSWKSPEFSDQRIPTLQQVLDMVGEGKRIFVEIKCGPEILPELERQLSASMLHPEQVVIISFDAEVVRQSRIKMPQYKANWLTSYKQKVEGGPWTPSLESVLAKLRATGATGLGTNGNTEVVDQAFAQAIKEAGFELHVWTVNDPEAAHHWVRLGVDSITTDRPRFLRQQLGL